MKSQSKRFLIHFNAPVILGMTAVSLLVLLANYLTRGGANSLFAAYRTSWADPFQYLRLFTHVLAHSSFSHYSGNFLMILAIGPMVEEKYGSRRLLLMIAVTALITGLIHVLFFRGALVGASGIVFMLILLASFTNIQEGTIPVTVVLVGVLYIGNEIFAGLTTVDNISRLSHIVGGLCGAGFGYRHHSDKLRRKKPADDFLGE